MKKIISCLLTAAMLVPAMPVFAAIETNYSVYDLNFDGGDVSAVTPGGAEVSCVEGGKGGGKAVFVDGCISEADVPYIGLKFLNRESYSKIIVSVKPVTEDTSATARLIVTLNENGTEKTYTLAEKKVSKNNWTELGSTLDTEYKQLTEAPKVSVVVTDSSGVCSYMIDDFRVDSDMPTMESYTEVPQLENNGNYTLRLAFENGTVEKLRRDMYTLQKTEFLCVDDIPAHSGQYSLLVSERMKGDWVICVPLDGIDYNSKVEISCWVHNGPGVAEAQYYIRGRLPLKAETKYTSISSTVTVKNDNWTELKAVIDLSDYELTGAPEFQIMTVNTGTDYVDYYVDDILVKADTPGKFYDDMNYTPPERGEEISDTAYCIDSKYIPVQKDIPSLKDVYKDYFKIGMANCDGAGIPGNGRYAQLMAKHCNSLVGEGGHKTNSIMSVTENGKKYDFSMADALTDFAHKNGFEIVGHCLVWEKSTALPLTQDANGNFLSRDEILANMKEFITKTITHFEGDGDASEYTVADYKNWHLPVWDVVNEAALGTTADGYANRSSGLYSVVGPDYVQYAFQYAEATGYDDIELRYNDFGEHNEDKLNAIYNLCKLLLDNGRKIDIIGMQSHYYADTSSASVRHAMEKLSSLGTKIDITELDINVYTTEQVNAGKKLYETGIPKEVEFIHATLYYDLFQLYKEYSDIIDRVVMWSMTDRLSHLNQAGTKKTNYGGIFDRNYQAKPEYWAIADPEYYLKEVLKDDSSKFRISFENKITAFEENEHFEENGIIYLEASALLNVLSSKLKYVTNGEYISIIKDEIYYEINSSTGAVTKNAEEYIFKNPAINRDGKLYVSYKDMCEMFNYGTDYSEQRNLISISEVAYGAIADA